MTSAYVPEDSAQDRVSTLERGRRATAVAIVAVAIALLLFW